MLKQALSAPVPPPSAPAPPANSSPGGPNVSAASNTSDTSFASCTSQDCFVTAANACQSSQWTSSDEVATWQYVSTRACVVSKTLVKLNGNESAQMKNLLEGKSMACLYAKGQFDSNLVTSWVAGTGNCNGPLKDAMGELLLFANSS